MSNAESGECRVSDYRDDYVIGYHDDYWFQQRYDAALLDKISEMTSPVRCTKCGTVYDLGRVAVLQRYLDCSVWKCPGCQCTVDDRPVGWGDHHYRELNENGFEKDQRRAT